jgi:hypothetical protein
MGYQHRHAVREGPRLLGRLAIVAGLLAVGAVFYQYVQVVQEMGHRGPALAQQLVAAKPSHAVDLFDSTQAVNAMRPAAKARPQRVSAEVGLSPP